MTKIITLLSTIIALFCCWSCRNARMTGESAETVAEPVWPLGFRTDTLTVEKGKVGNGETFSTLIMRLGGNYQDALTLASRSDSLFDVRKMRAGNAYDAYYASDSIGRQLRYLVYANDRINSTVFECSEPYQVWRVEKEVEHVRKNSDVTISSSLWKDMTDAGANPELILKLSDIYAWTVDFFGLQPGDRFRMTYCESFCEGESLSVDTVYFAEFSRGGSKLYSIMLDQGDGGNIYWNEKGESMRKAFLKAPLKFTRISSGFSYRRKHPVTGQVKAHTAVDYAAPTGTPVVSIGDGIVISAGYSGGGGNTVKIRHNSVYTTAYLHLSKYGKGIKAGQRVTQGQIIGYVGATGTATGPHLDFRVWMNGSPINPLKLESPPAEPIREENRVALDSLFNIYKNRYDGN